MMPLGLTLLVVAAASAPAPEKAIEQRPLRVLIAAGGPTREYQFVRSHFVRESERKGAEVCLYQQGSREPKLDPGVPAERVLSQFPTVFKQLDQPEKDPAVRFANLAHYEVIIAFDLDWTQMKKEQLELLEKWVSNHGSGLIVVGGPVHTFRLARASAKEQLKPLLDLLPVVPQDIRVVALDRAANEPWPLTFRGAGADMEFLRLDEERKTGPSGWDDFFGGPAKPGAEKPKVERGFYSCYPVQGAKPAATVVATYADPRTRLASGKEHPFLVVMSYGKGRVVWLGSGETWRLRQYKESFHGRFWAQLARYAATRPVPEKTGRGALFLDPQALTGTYLDLDAWLIDRDREPLGDP